MDFMVNANFLERERECIVGVNFQGDRRLVRIFQRGEKLYHDATFREGGEREIAVEICIFGAEKK